MIVGGGDVLMASVILGSISGTIIVVARLWFRRLEARDRFRAMQGDVDERLLRIEQAVDAIALEVERSVETQRATSRILAERLSSDDALSGSTARKKLT